MHKHAFDLRTGRCLDDETHSVPVYDVVVEDGMVLVGRRKQAVGVTVAAMPGRPSRPARARDRSRATGSG